MKEKEWVDSIIGNIEKQLRTTNNKLSVTSGYRLPYSSEILEYKSDEPNLRTNSKYETDILIFENLKEEIWKPRVIIEAKLGSVTTHDAITYSQKAQTHKNVHPYLRYGILIGNREHYPLPGRLFRHGQHFDFMMSWKSLKSDDEEITSLVKIINSEIQASKMLEEIIFNNRSKTRERFTVLHKPLNLS